jgi:hypothetical protein
VDMHATDLVGINGSTRVLLVYTCQQGVCPRGHVPPLRLPKYTYKTLKSRAQANQKEGGCNILLRNGLLKSVSFHLLTHSVFSFLISF